jgi:hypothetical protein
VADCVPIKSQLLCQVSYAPTANGNVGTNLLLRSTQLLISGALRLGRHLRIPDSDSRRPSPDARDQKRVSGITPAQQEAMRSCQEQRNGGHGGGHVGDGHGGPCGEMSVPHSPHPQKEDELPPNETPRPS